jgi:hypothetical protein
MAARSAPTLGATMDLPLTSVKLWSFGSARRESTEAADADAR